MNIEELLNKYFEGETSCEEERELRHFFTQGIVPEHLKEYSPLFAFLEKENRQAKTTDTEPATKQRKLRRHAIYTLSGIAAGLLLLLGIAGIHRHPASVPNKKLRYIDIHILVLLTHKLNREVSHTLHFQ